MSYFSGFWRDQFGFRREKGTRDGTGMRRISEKTLDIDKELCLLPMLAEDT
jgi:hypothetical protein